MSLLSALWLAFAGGFLASGFMYAGLRRNGALEVFRLRPRDLLAPTVPGALLAACLITGQSDTTAVFAIAVSIALPGLSLMAWVDRVAAWAPTECLLPVSMAVGVAAMPGAPLAAAGATLVLFAGCHAAWAGQIRSGHVVISPADIMALAAPIVLFQLSYWAMVTFLVTAFLMLMALRFSSVARFFSRPDAVADATEDTGMSGRHPVTFLSVILPVLITVIALRGTLEGSAAAIGLI